MKRTSLSRHRGFTLVELLVVVSIIALLISILLPSLKKARTQAKVVKCGTQLHDIGVGFSAYAVEFNRFPTQNTFGDGPLIPGQNRSNRSAIGVLTYAVHQEIARHMGGLQANKAGAIGPDGRPLLTRQHEVFYCPFVNLREIEQADELHGDWPDGTSTGRGSHTSEDVYLQVTYNYFGGLHEVANDPAKSNSFPVGASEEMKQYLRKKRESYVQKDANGTKVLFADMVMMWTGGPKWRINHGQGWATNIPSGNFSPPRVDGANLLYGDAHVEWKGPRNFRELIELPSGSTSRLNALRGGTLVRQADVIWW